MADIVNNEVFDVLSVLGYGPISSGISSGKIKAVLLTGSRSMSADNPNSDYDIAVHFESDRDRLSLKIPGFRNHLKEKVFFVKNSSEDVERLLSGDADIEAWAGVQFFLPFFSESNVLYESGSFLSRPDIGDLFDKMERSMFLMLRDEYMEVDELGRIIGYKNSKRLIWAVALDSIRGRFTRGAGLLEVDYALVSQIASSSFENGSDQVVLSEQSLLNKFNSIRQRVLGPGGSN
jgi:predicted nucleotidyltransferase